MATQKGITPRRIGESTKDYDDDDDETEYGTLPLSELAWSDNAGEDGHLPESAKSQLTDSDAIVAQRSVGRKPCVYMFRRHVLKGPFANSLANMKRHALVKRRERTFHLLGQRCATSTMLLENDNERVWMLMDRIDATNDSTCTATAKIMTMANGRAAHIMKRGSAAQRRIRDLSAAELTPELCANVIVALAARLVCEPICDDSDLLTVLVGTGAHIVWQVDIEEIREQRTATSAACDGSWAKALSAKGVPAYFVKVCDGIFIPAGSHRDIFAARWADFRKKVMVIALDSETSELVSAERLEQVEVLLHAYGA